MNWKLITIAVFVHFSFISLIQPLLAEEIQIVTEEFPPYNYTENGEVTGISTEVVKAVLEELGIDVTIKSYPWSRAYLKAKHEKNTLIYSIGRNKKREKLFQWVGKIIPINTCMFSLKDREDIIINSLDDSKKYRVGTQRESKSSEFLIENGFIEGKNLTNVVDIEQLFAMLYYERIDLWIMPEFSIYQIVRDNEYEPEELIIKKYCLQGKAHMYMAFGNNTSTEVVDRFRLAFDNIKKNGIYQSIIDKYNY